MNYAQIRNEISKAEERISAVKAGASLPSGARSSLDELKARRKELKRQLGSVLLLDEHDAARQRKIRHELDQSETDISAIDAEVEALQAAIEGHKQYLSEQAVIERKRAAIKAGERVAERATSEVPALAERIDTWMREGEALFKQLDEVVKDNSRDLGAMATTACEDVEISPTAIAEPAQRVLNTAASAIELRMGSVIAQWLIRCGFQHRAPVEILRPMGTEVSVVEQLELHGDALLQIVRELRERIERAPDEDAHDEQEEEDQ